MLLFKNIILLHKKPHATIFIRSLFSNTLHQLWMAVKSTHTNAQEDDGMVKLKAPPRCDVKDFKIENMTADDIRVLKFFPF